jgi:hypothetical protein
MEHPNHVFLNNMKIRSREIEPSDFAGVATLLGKGLGYPPEYYLEIFHALERHDTPPGFPKYGYLLEANKGVVGGIIVIYSRITHTAIPHIRCHVSGWYVDPNYRLYAAMLAAKATGRKDVCYLNVSARPATRSIIEAQGFHKYSNGQFLSIPLFHLFDKNTDVELTPFGHEPPGEITADAFDLMSAHDRYGCLCLWYTIEKRSYPLIFRSKSFKGFIPGVQLIYCGDVNMLTRCMRNIGIYLAKRGLWLVSIDANGPIPGLKGKYFDGVEPRFYKGQQPAVGDLAFTLKAMLTYVRRPSLTKFEA